jgi:hypothetical protein
MRAGIADFLHYLLTPVARAPWSRRGPERKRRRRIPRVELLETRLTPSVTTNTPNTDDFQINLTGGDTVILSENNFKLDVVAAGQDLGLQPASSSYLKITINAANGIPDSIDLSGVSSNLADFVQLSTIVVNRDRTDTVNPGFGWSPVGTETINGQLFQDFTQGHVVLKMTSFTRLPQPHHRHRPRHPHHHHEARAGGVTHDFPG